MRISDVRVVSLSYPRERAISNSTITSRSVEATLCFVDTAEGLTGVGFAYSRGISPIIQRSLRERVLDEEPFCVERLWMRMFRGWRKPVAKGLVINAISAVDIALWDLMGKALRMPVYKLLGGYRSRIPAYAAGGYYEEGKGLKELAGEMEGYVSLGYRAVKMKVGRLSLERDVERVKAVRRAVGDEVDVMVDANNAWNAYQAIKFARMCEGCNIYWLEEPVAPDDLEGSVMVASTLEIPVASSENEFTRYGFRDLIERHAVDILQADAGVCGGVTEWRKIADMASAHHLPISPHGSEDIHVHLAAAVSNGLIVETYPHVDPLRRELFTKTACFKEGYLELPERPGFGLELDEAGIKKYRVEE